MKKTAIYFGPSYEESDDDEEATANHGSLSETTSVDTAISTTTLPLDVPTKSCLLSRTCKDEIKKSVTFSPEAVKIHTSKFSDGNS